MGIQALFLMGISFGASVSASGACFDFSTKIVRPLQPEIELKTNGENKNFGKREDGVTFAFLRTKVDKPIQEILTLLLDRKLTTSKKVQELSVEKIPDPNFLERQRAKFVIKPFLFIVIRWVEEWGFALAEGTREDPKQIVISQEKTEGTSHIERLCASIVLRKLSSTSTDVFFYEEAKATQRSPQDTMHGLEGTLNELRKTGKPEKETKDS